MTNDHSKPKAKVYIDGANMFYAQKKLGWIFDKTISWELKLESSHTIYLEDIKEKIKR